MGSCFSVCRCWLLISFTIHARLMGSPGDVRLPLPTANRCISGHVDYNHQTCRDYPFLPPAPPHTMPHSVQVAFCWVVLLTLSSAASALPKVRERPDGPTNLAYVGNGAKPATASSQYPREMHRARGPQ